MDLFLYVKPKIRELSRNHICNAQELSSEAASILGENKKSAHSEFIRQAHTFGVILGNTYGSSASNQPKKSKKTRIKNNLLMLDEELTKNIEIMAELSGMKKEEFVLTVLNDITEEHKDIIGAYKLARARIGA